jgi:cytochrome c-type biogenesis protein CcmH/NrfF
VTKEDIIRFDYRKAAAIIGILTGIVALFSYPTMNFQTKANAAEYRKIDTEACLQRSDAIKESVSAIKTDMREMKDDTKEMKRILLRLEAKETVRGGQ